MVERGEIDDGKTVILLQWAAMQRARVRPAPTADSAAAGQD